MAHLSATSRQETNFIAISGLERTALQCSLTACQPVRPILYSWHPGHRPISKSNGWPAGRRVIQRQVGGRAEYLRHPDDVATTGTGLSSDIDLSPTIILPATMAIPTAGSASMVNRPGWSGSSISAGDQSVESRKSAVAVRPAVCTASGATRPPPGSHPAFTAALAQFHSFLPALTGPGAPAT